MYARFNQNQDHKFWLIYHIRKTAPKSLDNIEIIVISSQTLAQRTLKPSSFQVVDE